MPLSPRSSHGCRTRSSTTRRLWTADSSSLLGNDDYLLRQIASGEREQAREYAAWLLGAAGGYAIKIVNPGGIELWKRGDRGPLTALDAPLGSSRVTPRAIIETLVDAGNGLRLPHAAAHSLQQPRRRRATSRPRSRACARVEGRRAHFTHLQFHSYGVGAKARGDPAPAISSST